jgi:hypothetical protein
MGAALENGTLTGTPAARQPQPPNRVRIGLIAAAVAIVLLGLLLWIRRPHLTEEEVRAAAYTTIQRETPRSFLVTGTLDLVGTSTISHTTRLLPGLLDIELSRSKTTLRLPARVAYGFDVRTLKPEMIRLEGDSVVAVTIPALTVFSVEPNLSAMEVETKRGWLRLSDADARRIERNALLHVDRALRVQAEAHLRDSNQPRENTARALADMLRAPMVAAGMKNPRFRFEIAGGVVMEQ